MGTRQQQSIRLAFFANKKHVLGIGKTAYSHRTNTEWNESIHLKTWGKSRTDYLSSRFRIFDEEGNRIIATTSAWVILNKKILNRKSNT